MGWQLICLFVEQLEAKLEVNHELGTAVKLVFSELNYHRRI
jgi:two-component sensor histidine kinase